MKPLLSASQLASIRTTAETGFQTEIEIRRPDFGSDSMGDDEPDPEPALIARVKGWISQPSMDQANVDIAAILTASSLRLSVPVGTDIRPRDRVIVVSSGNTYIVQDTNADETWPAMTRALLKITE